MKDPMQFVKGLYEGEELEVIHLTEIAHQSGSLYCYLATTPAENAYRAVN